MIHIHVIITAVVLLVGAFAALLICLCVDIVPIIKSRGSTLASRDSTTREQAQKLKKSLQQARLKTIQEQESELLDSSDNLKKAEGGEDGHSANIVVATTVTGTTTTTVVVEASPFKEDHVINSCLAVPDGDNSAQRSSTANSSIEHPQVSSRKISQEIQEPCDGENFVKQLITNDTCAVTASVFSCQPTCCDDVSSQSACCLRGNAVDNTTTQPVRSVTNQSKIRSRPNLAMVSHSKRTNHTSSTHHTNYGDNNIKQHNQKPNSSRFCGKQQRPNRLHCSNTSCHTNPSLPQSLDAYPATTGYDCATGSDRLSPASGNDYHDAPWDTPYKERSDVHPCCYCQSQYASSGYVEKNSDENILPTEPLLATSHNQHDEFPNYKRQPKSHYSKQHRSHGKPCSYSSHSITASLHGTGGASPHSSLSSSPSSLSSSSHSGQRSRGTKLEDIQEASGWSEEETGAPQLTETVSPADRQVTRANEARDHVDSPLHSCVSSVKAVGHLESTNSVVTKNTGSEEFTESRRIKLSRTFVLDMKAAIEGAVIDKPVDFSKE